MNEYHYRNARILSHSGFHKYTAVILTPLIFIKWRLINKIPDDQTAVYRAAISAADTRHDIRASPLCVLSDCHDEPLKLS